MIELIGKPNPIYSIYANIHISLNINNWRKPNPHIINHAADRFNINFSKSILIGDRISDMLAGLNSGINNLFHVETGQGINERNQISKNINKHGFFSYLGLLSEIILLENSNSFPYKMLNKKI
tara:strand:+ start:6137 stop:6505 length:369 start_codon:yes stop_codon:yes gene_type:complete